MSERRIAAGGADLYCTEEGSGPAVLLIHAGGGDATTWGGIATMLRERSHVIAYDRRGYSRSAPAEKVTLARHGDDAASVLELLAGEPAVVVGLSAGATIALQLAVTRPDLVNALVLHEPPFHGKRHPSLPAIRAVVGMQRRAKRGRVIDAAEGFMRWAYAYPTGDSAYDAYPEAWRDIARANAASTVHDVAAIATGESISRRQLRDVRCPVICTVGERSRQANRTTMRRLDAWLPNSTLEVVAGAAHEVALTNPEAIARHTMTLVSQRDGHAALPARTSAVASA